MNYNEMNYDKMTDEQLHRFAAEIAERSISVEEVRKRVFEIGYPFQFLFVAKRPFRRGFAITLQGHQWLISVE